MKTKVIFLLSLIIIGTIFMGQAAYAANPILSVSPATASKNVGATFNVSVNLDPQGNKACVIQGILNFDNLSCQSITVASNVLSQTAPTCASPSFLLGVPGCITSAQNFFSVSVKGVQVGPAKVSLTDVDVIGAGTDIPSSSNNGAYNITEIPNPAVTATKSTSATSTSTTNTPASCTPNWQIGSWGDCVDNQQTRTVTDLNNCGSVINEPDTVQSCIGQPSTPNPGVAGLLTIASKYFWPLLIIFIIFCIGYFIFWWFIIAKRRKKEDEDAKK